MRFHTFVVNMIAVIRDGTNPSQCQYVKPKANPADEASRGLEVNTFLNDRRWSNGPEFLWKPELPQSPGSETYEGIPDGDPEVKQNITVSAITVSESQNMMNQHTTHHSSWFKLKKHVAWILKV